VFRQAAKVLLVAALAAATAGAAAADGAYQDYVLYCMGCHGEHAEGVPGKIPPLAGSLARFMRLPAGRDYLLRVPGAANSVLSDARLTAVLNWLATHFDGEELTPDVPLFTVEEVTRSRHSPLASVKATRTQVVRDLAASGPSPPASY
jgi:mono/diheme cytochrome c family protein